MLHSAQLAVENGDIGAGINNCRKDFLDLSFPYIGRCVGSVDPLMKGADGHCAGRLDERRQFLLGVQVQVRVFMHEYKNCPLGRQSCVGCYSWHEDAGLKSIGGFRKA